MYLNVINVEQKEPLNKYFIILVIPFTGAKLNWLYLDFINIEQKEPLLNKYFYK